LDGVKDKEKKVKESERKKEQQQVTTWSTICAHKTLKGSSSVYIEIE